MVDTNQILDALKLGVNKINEIIMFIAKFIAEWAKLDINNVYLILIIALSLWAARRIMMFIYASAEEGRTTTWLMIAGGIFAILYFLK